MRLFQMIRDDDVSGVSGVGRVAEVVEFENGKVVVAWLDGAKAMGVYDSLDDVQAVHGHDGTTWLEAGELEPPRVEPDVPPKKPTYRGARLMGRRI